MIVASPSAANLLADLAAHDIDVQLQGGVIRFRPRSAMTPALLQQLQAHKAELMMFLNTEVAATELRQGIASLWKDPAWQSAWERRFRAGKYADFASLKRVLNSIIDRAEEHHRRREWKAFTTARDLLCSIASGEIWDRVLADGVDLDWIDQFSPDLTAREQMW